MAEKEGVGVVLQKYVASRRETLRDELVDLLGALVRERTVNVVESRLPQFPYLKARGEETRTARIVRAWAERLGLATETHARCPERENVLIRYGRGQGRTLFVPGHMDVVPPGEGWKDEPFAMRVENGRAIGRGVADNKGPLAATLLALKLLKDTGLEPAGLLVVGALADEEAMGEDGKDYGMQYLLEEGRLRADYAVVPDIGGQMKKIDVAEKGRAVFIVQAAGKQAHGSTPEKGINAIDAMAEFLMRLKAHPFGETRHPLLGGCTVNVGEISGGSAPNIVPAHCQASLDIRIVPGQDVEAIRRELENLGAGLGAGIRVTVQSATGPHAIEPEAPWVQKVRHTAAALSGKMPEIIGLGGGTYAKPLNRHGIPAIGFGPGEEDAMHAIEESIDLDELLDFSLLLAVLAMELAE